MDINEFKSELQNDSDIMKALADAISEANYANANALAEALEALRDDYEVERTLHYYNALNSACLEDFFELANI